MLLGLAAKLVEKCRACGAKSAGNDRIRCLWHTSSSDASCLNYSLSLFAQQAPDPKTYWTHYGAVEQNNCNCEALLCSA
jgi:hypothetical protein